MTKLEENLQLLSSLHLMLNYLAQYGERSEIETTSLLLKTILTDECATNYNFKGCTGSKYPFKDLTILNIIIDSMSEFLLNELSHPTMYVQRFDQGLFGDDVFVRPSQYHCNTQPILINSNQRPSHLNSAAQSGSSLLQNDKDNFKVNVDVQQFKPEEVFVKVVDGYIVVDGKHEERTDEHGFISRQFTRRYKVPENVDPSAIISTLSLDGVLTVGAPKKVKSIEGER